MDKNENIEIKRMLDILKSKKILVICIVILFTLFGYIYSFYYVVPQYKSTSTLLLIPDNVSEQRTISHSDLMVNSGLIETYCNLAKNTKILKQVIANLSLDLSEKELLDKMQVNIKKDTYIIQISVTDTEPQKAMEIANELDKIFLKEIVEIYHLNNIGIIDEAQIEEQPYNINHIKDIGIFFVIGIAVSLAYLMIIYLFDNTIKKEEEIEKYIQIKSLGSIPIHNDEKQEIVDRKNAKSYVTECINTIRTNILYMNSTKEAKTILITSCTPREGKSWVSANMAVCFAETDKKVLLIDADMRKGRAHRIFKVKNTEGLSNYLYFMTGERKEDIKKAKEYIQETSIPNLHILTNGTIPPNPSELLESNNMKDLLMLLKKMYDMIIIDAPPCKLVTDSIILSTIVDSTVLVANAEKTKIQEFNEVKKSIQMVGGEIIGAILNKTRITKKTYEKKYYYGHADPKDRQEMQKKPIYPVEEIIQQAIATIEEEQTQKEKNKVIEKEVQVNDTSIQDDTKEKKLKILEEEQMKEMIRQVVQDSSEKIVNHIKNRVNKEQEIQQVFHHQITRIQKETQELVQKEMAKIDYTEQISQINEMLANLNDSYLELANKIRTNNDKKDREETYHENNNRNIIDFKAFKRQRSKKRVYSIEEDIYSVELEEMASYVIPLPKRNKVIQNNNQKIMW